MATYFRMPGVSADSDEAVLESWTVEQGAQVASGQTIASVETEKAVVDVESDVDAVVHTLLVENGATVPVGDPIAILLGVDEPAAAAEKLLADLGLGGAPAGGDAPDVEEASTGTETQVEKELDAAVQSVPEDATPPDGPANVDETPVAQHVAVGAEPAANGNGGRRFSSPSARRLARELGVDVSTLSGSGPKGRVVNADVRRPPPPSLRRPHSRPPRRLPLRQRPPQRRPRPCPRGGPRSRTAGSARSSRRGCRSPRTRHRTSTCGCPRGWTRCSRCARSSTPRAG
jgi:pyruvate dehydrogenase E2 component (dihydrolipoamide acetyltransferase)